MNLIFFKNYAIFVCGILNANLFSPNKVPVTYFHKKGNYMFVFQLGPEVGS